MERCGTVLADLRGWEVPHDARPRILRTSLLNYARLMVVTANTYTGPRAYAGLASSYGELITENWESLNDEQWAERVQTQPFPEAPWMSGVLAE